MVIKSPIYFIIKNYNRCMIGCEPHEILREFRNGGIEDKLKVIKHGISDEKRLKGRRKKRQANKAPMVRTSLYVIIISSIVSYYLFYTCILSFQNFVMGSAVMSDSSTVDQIG